MHAAIFLSSRYGGLAIFLNKRLSVMLFGLAIQFGLFEIFAFQLFFL
jgi:hypothetical protein